jgi:hypothetical protein
VSSEIVERSPSHFLTRDDDGWALWGVDQDDDEPLLTFDADGAGEERARRAFATRTKEAQRVRWLVVAAVVSGALWVLFEVAILLYARWGPDPTYAPFDADAFGGRYEELLFGYLLQVGNAVAWAVFVVATGWFLVAWLHRRWRREG